MAAVLTSAQRADIIRSRGKESATDIAVRLGVKRNSVLSTWSRFRRSLQQSDPRIRAIPRETPETVVGLHGVSIPRLRFLENAQ